jgi:DNA polymerase I-like protein with 3'-5' exonuclease and polymerase domains
MNIAVLDLETSMKPILHPWQRDSFLSTIGLQVYLDTGMHYYMEWIYQHDERPHISELDRLSTIWEIQEHIDKVDMIVGHNLKFDMNWLRFKNVDFTGKQLWCTQSAEFMLSGQDKTFDQDLSSCCLRHGLQPKTDQVKSYWDAGRNTNTIPLRILLPYQKNDVLITAQLFKDQYRQAKQRPNLFKLIEVRNYCLHVASELELNGMNWDETKAHKWVDHFEKKLDDTNTELRCYFGRDDINLDSGPELSACLFGGLIKRTRYLPLVYTRNVIIKEPYQLTYKSGKLKGQTVTKYRNRTLKELTCKKRKEDYAVKISGVGFNPPDGSNTSTEGVYQTNKDVLKNLTCGRTGGTSVQTKKRVLELLVHRSKIAQFKKTFIGAKADTGLFYNVSLNADGIPHPSYNQTNTATGRWSSSNPNGQNFPRSKEDEDGFSNPLKSVFIASRPGGLILVVDLSQLEWRVAAWLSQDPIAMQEIMNNVDCHLDNAIKFFGDAKYRQDAKIMTFRLLYGGGAYAFFKDPKMPDFTMKKWNHIVNSYRRKYSGITNWQERNIRQVPIDGGYLYSPLGRIYCIPMEEHRKYPGTMIHKETAIKNYPVQGTATGDIVPLATNLMYDRMNANPMQFISTNWMGQVHDSMIFDTMPDEVKRVAFTGIQVFEDLPVIISDMFNVDFNLPLTGEAEWGPDYGTMTHSVKHEEGQWILKVK